MTHIAVSNDDVIQISGDWTLRSGARLHPQVQSLTIPSSDEVAIDAKELQYFDTSGALLVSLLIDRLKEAGKTFRFQNLSEQYRFLLDLTSEEHNKMPEPPPSEPEHGFFYRVGENTVEKVKQGLSFMNFFGEVSTIFGHVFTLRRKLHWNSVLYGLEEGGYQALPIIALLMFLIGIVLAYQLGQQLSSYGANIFIVNLTGIAVLREFGPLIAAIIAAGRTSSSYTAQIGLMKVNEELDALTVMGMSPINRIAVPKLIAIVLAMPLLTIWSDAFGVFGSMVMSEVKFDIQMADFIQRFDDVTEVSSLWTGLLKAPFFGLIIASVGCFKGFKVKYTSESIGQETTKSVVQAIFMVIVADAIFSVMFSWAGV